MNKKPTGTAIAVLGAVLALWSVTTPAWGLGVLIGAAMIVSGIAVATTPRRLLEIPPREHAHRWNVNVVVPAAPALAPTLEQMLEDDVVGLRIQADEEHWEIIVSFKVQASGRDVAERIGKRALERHGLIVDAVGATRA